MSNTIKRRAFLKGGAALGAVGLVGAQIASESEAAKAPSPLETAEKHGVDSRVAAIIARSRGRSGSPHITQVAFASAAGIVGTLLVTADETHTIREALAKGDYTAMQERGVYVGGKKLVFIRHDDDDAGVVLHAVRRGGEFFTARAFGDQLVMATSGVDNAHGCAVEALYQHAKAELQHSVGVA